MPSVSRSSSSTPKRSRATPTASPRASSSFGGRRLNPATLVARGHAAYATDLVDMITEDLVAERVAIASYQEIIRWLSTADTTTRRMLEDILGVEEEHADALLNLLKKLGQPT